MYQEPRGNTVYIGSQPPDPSGAVFVGSDRGVINVRSALYGRIDSETCSEGRSPQQLADTQCFQQDTLGVVKKQCDGMKVCVLNTTAIRTFDPCPGISKYLDTTHSCVPTDGGQGIFVYSANYGRQTHAKCDNERPYPQLQNTHCMSETSKRIVAESCNGKSKCAIEAANSVFGNTCVGTYKYLALSYRCQYQTVACEDSEASLKCVVGKVLIIYSAVYGRSDRTTCASGRPESEIQDVRCSQFSSKVAESCDGKNSCVISASSAVFGDPCVGTYKYLMVDYTCQVPSERWTV
ncbi:L-rhamnose-binding lectin CSL3-like [Chaetodon auriga]|uniref:L-rhamnose-binding lectin CSL3-like n=1 Tax=Chaetodon auriga TaxID=39042 RepID=UPI004032C333